MLYSIVKLLLEHTLAQPHKSSRPVVFRLQLEVRVWASGSIREVQSVGTVWLLDKVGTGGHFLFGRTVSGAGRGQLWNYRNPTVDQFNCQMISSNRWITRYPGRLGGQLTS